MNRNDLVIAPSCSVGISSSSDRGFAHAPRSPRKSSASPSPSGRQKKSASSLFMGGGMGGVSGLSFPKGSPLLEGESVHLALPSFHARAGGNNGVWKCIACQHENHSALSNECSVCGMIRSEPPREGRSGQDVSIGSSDPSDNSFVYDGNQSENSLSLHNSFSAVDPQLGEELAPYSFGHASLPTGLTASMSTAATARMHNSFSVTPSTRTPRSSRTGRRIGGRGRFGGGLSEEDGNSSVRSFSDWNGNEQIKSWQCPTCTFINENVLHLNCEMCGHLRNSDTASESTPSVAAAAATAASSSQDPDLDEDAYLAQLQEEQLRELVGLQEEIMAGFESERAAAQGTAFDFHDLDDELGHLQGDIKLSSRPPMNLGHVDDSDDEDCDEETRLQELLAAQSEILKDFQTGRSEPTWEPISPYRLNQKPSAFPSPRTRACRPSYNDPLFGQAASNTAPQMNVAISLKESMQAAGGKLRIEDICVPLLWGETLSSEKIPSSGKIHT